MDRKCGEVERKCGGECYSQWLSSTILLPFESVGSKILSGCIAWDGGEAMFRVPFHGAGSLSQPIDTTNSAS